MQNSNELSPKNIVMSIYSDSLQNINMAFALVAAFAWHEAVRQFIKTNFPATRSNNLFTYAILMTVVAVIVFNLTRKYLLKDIKALKTNAVIVSPQSI